MATARQRTVTVYPNSWVYEVLGEKRPVVLNQAIECWAVALRLADAGLKPRQKALLALAVAGRKLDPQDTNIALTLAGAVRLHHKGQAADELARHLESLDYVRAWSAVWSCRPTTLRPKDEE